MCSETEYKKKVIFFQLQKSSFLLTALLQIGRIADIKIHFSDPSKCLLSIKESNFNKNGSTFPHLLTVGAEGPPPLYSQPFFNWKECSEITDLFQISNITAKKTFRRERWTRDTEDACNARKWQAPIILTNYSTASVRIGWIGDLWQFTPSITSLLPSQLHNPKHAFFIGFFKWNL